MRKLFTIFTLLITSFASQLLADEGVQHLDDETFADAIEQGIVIVDFYADWCPPCRRFAPTFAEFAGMLEEQNEDEDIPRIAYKVNVDHASETSQTQGIRAIPTVVSYKYGEEVERRVGAPTMGELLEMVNTAEEFGDEE